MNYSYKKLSNKNYLVLEDFDTSISANDYRLEMQKRNNIHGLLPLSLSTQDNVLSFNYDITSRQALYSYFYDNKLLKEHIITFFNDLNNTLSTLDKFLLDYDNLVLIPQCIFCSKEIEQFFFVYCPNHQKSFYEELKELISYFLTITDHDDEQTVLISYGLWQIVQTPDFNMNSLLSIINKYNVKNEKIETIKTPPTNETHPVDFDSNILKEPAVLLKENYTYDSKFIIKNVTLFSLALIIIIINIGLKIMNFYSMELFFIIMLVISMFCIFTASSAIKDAPLYRVFDKSPLDASKDNILTIAPSINENLHKEEIISENNETVLLCVNPAFKQHKLVYAGMDFVQEITIEGFPFSIGKSTLAAV